MERLWSPWRLSYVTGAANDKNDKNDGCVFCAAAASASADDPDSLLVARGVSAFVILNRYPYNNGHLLIAPNRHVASLAELTSDELSEIMRLTRDAETALTESYRPNGINVGMNLGRAAGAGIADHLHMHIVPRWNGDTSFMSVVGGTRVLPEELGQTAERLRPVFARLAKT